MTKRTLYSIVSVIVILQIAAGCTIYEQARATIPAVVPLSGGYLRRLEVVVDAPDKGSGVGIADEYGVVTSTLAIDGIVRYVDLDYGHTIAVTTVDVLILGVRADRPMTIPIVSVTDWGTNTTVVPMNLTKNATNTLLSTGLANVASPVYVDTQVVMTVSDLRITDTVTATIIYQQMR